MKNDYENLQLETHAFLDTYCTKTCPACLARDMCDSARYFHLHHAEEDWRQVEIQEDASGWADTVLTRRQGIINMVIGDTDNESDD